MKNKPLKYELSQEEVNYLLQALNRVQIVGLQSAESLVHMFAKLKTPLNKEDLEKEQLESLKGKYEDKSKK